MLPLILLALTPNALGAEPQKCDLRALKKELAETSPIAAAKVYQQIVACDEKQGKALAPTAFGRILAGDDGNAAALDAIRIGAGADVRTWLNGMEPDQRSRSLVFLGEQCKAQPSVQGFFTEAHAAMGMDFYKDRWHRGLADCRVEPIQAFLKAAINDKQLAKDRTRLFNVLEVYARNLRAEAIPALIELANATSDEEEQTYLINAFADTTGIGSVEGLNADAASKATAAIRDLGPKLKPRAVEQARITLRTLGDEVTSDRFAAFRWPDRKTGDGNYRYAVALRESATCKNKKKIANFYVAAFDEGGVQWPDQIKPLLLEKLQYEWELTAASKCKGEGTFDVMMPDQPFAGDDERTLWIETQVKAFTDSAPGLDKAKVLRQPPFLY
jgi:hypothetical protein